MINYLEKEKIIRNKLDKKTLNQRIQLETKSKEKVRKTHGQCIKIKNKGLNSYFVLKKSMYRISTIQLIYINNSKIDFKLVGSN